MPDRERRARSDRVSVRSDGKIKTGRSFENEKEKTLYQLQKFASASVSELLLEPNCRRRDYEGRERLSTFPPSA